jgi:hypothetical protein
MTTESKRREAMAQQIRATMQPTPRPSPLGVALANTFLYAAGAAIGYGIYTLSGVPQALLIGAVAVFLISLVMAK